MSANTDIDIAARDLDWEGCGNVRDLGGLPTVGGGETVRGRIVRANNLDLLTRDGWQALWDYGVRTVIDLRNEEECRGDVVRPTGLTKVRVPFDAYASADWEHSIERLTQYYAQEGIGAFKDDYLRDPDPRR